MASTPKPTPGNRRMPGKGPQASHSGPKPLALAKGTTSPADANTADNGTRKKGAPNGNKNGEGNCRHGLRAGSLPPGCKHVEQQCNGIRRELEQACMDAKGEISLVDAAIIQTCLKWERHGALALRWLRLKTDELKPSELLQFSREIARASSERDRAIAALHLDYKPEASLATYLAESQEVEPHDT